MSTTIWKQHLPASSQHHWFEAFEENGLEAADALLLGRFDLANLAVEEPSVLLTTWVRIIGDRGGFSTLLDDALSAWIDKNWAKSDHASIAMIRSVWDQLGIVISATAPPAPNPCPLAKAATTLRVRLGDHSGFATTLFAFRGRDAFHTCLNAVALSQRDDELRTLWWRLIELPGGFPIRYASVALNGLRCLHDPEHGEWFASTSEDGTPRQTGKGSEWKAAYHVTQACAYAQQYLSELEQAS